MKSDWYKIVSVFELDPTRGVSIRTRARRYRINDSALRQLVQQFDQNQNIDDDGIIQ